MGEERSGYLAERAALAARVVIEAWLADIGVGVEHADALARRLHAATIPFDAHAETVERCVVDALLWMADRNEAHTEAAARLRTAAARVSAVFVDAGLVEQPYCSLPDASEPADDAYPSPGDAGRPMRYDWVYARPVSVRMKGRRYIVRFPPFDGRVRVEHEGMRPMVVAVDDLDEDAGRRSLASSHRVRRRVELHARCAVRGCGRAFRAWLDAETLTVENTRGETICHLTELPRMMCELHDDAG